jgi:hypothetical protein
VSKSPPQQSIQFLNNHLKMNTSKSCSCRYPDLTYFGLCKKCKKVCIPVTEVIQTVLKKVLHAPILRDYYDLSVSDYVNITKRIERVLWEEMEEEGYPKLNIRQCLTFYKKKAETATQEVLYIFVHMAKEIKKPLKSWTFYWLTTNYK